MEMNEDTQHDLLLVITGALFVLFATGLTKPSEVSGQTIVIPPA